MSRLNAFTIYNVSQHQVFLHMAGTASAVLYPALYLHRCKPLGRIVSAPH